MEKFLSVVLIFSWDGAQLRILRLILAQWHMLMIILPMNTVELAVGFWCYTFGGISFVVLGHLLLFVFVQDLQLASGRLVGWVQLHHLCKHSYSFVILMKINQRQA